MPSIKYVSSRNVAFDLLDFDYAKLYEANFHKVEWIPDTVTKQYGVTVTRFTKDPQIFDCKFRFRGSHARRKAQIDAFMFQTEYDVSHNKTGRIWWDEQYINCFMNISSTYPDEDGYTTIEAQFYCPYPFWIEELKIIIKPSDAYTEGFLENVKKYDPAYPYDYSYPPSDTATRFTVNSALDSDFMAILYGPTSLCQFAIDGYTYTVNQSLRIGQKLVLDTRDTTDINERCYIINENGTTTNVFDYRDVQNSIFKKIPTGAAILDYTRTFGISLIVYQERSAPI